MDVGDLHFGVFGYTSYTTQLYFGMFEYTGDTVQLCYYLPVSLPWIDDDIMYHVTCAFILYPIAAVLAGIPVLLGLCGAAYHRAGIVFINLIVGLALLCTLVAWVTSTVVFGIQYTQMPDNFDVTLGNAIWIGLGALVSLLLGFCNTACGVCGGSRRTRRE